MRARVFGWLLLEANIKFSVLFVCRFSLFEDEKSITNGTLSINFDSNVFFFHVR